MSTTPPLKYKFSKLYQYATKYDLFMLGLGVLLTGIYGAMFPCMALIFGDAIASFAPYNQSKINNASLLYLLLAIVLFVTDFLSYALFQRTCKRQVTRLCEEFLAHVLHLDMEWYDKNDPLQLSSRLIADTAKIQEGMGQKLGDSIRCVCQFITGMTIGLVKGWEISLVMACVIPFIALSLGSLIKILRARSEHSQQVYADSGSIAEETLGSMRTVISNNGESRAIEKFLEKTRIAEAKNISVGRISSFFFGVFFCSMWIMNAAGVWYGGKKVSDDESTPAKVFQAFYGILTGSIAMAQIAPNVSAVVQAQGAAAALFDILATSSKVDASKESQGIKPEACLGKIEVVNVNFTYPTRPQTKIMNNYSVCIESKQIVAIVGASGGGKSTLVGLLERFYTPDSGSVLLDGRDIQELNVKWLRSQIGLVSQEPVLFATTIRENIGFGSQEKAFSLEEIQAAAQSANAHEFIMALPEQYETFVGEKGVSLSGGQKQRIAIARALIREPSILVLDEATSALDNESEQLVQNSLNDLMTKTNMTTIIIAHRLSTIRHADKIIVLADGTVVEEGSHDMLMEKSEGIYRRLYTAQEANPPRSEDGMELTQSRNSLSRSLELSKKLSTNSESRIEDKCSSDCSSHEILVSPSLIHRSSFIWRRLLHLCQPESKHFVYGTLASAICGFSSPGSSLLISEIITIMNTQYVNFKTTLDRRFLSELYNDVQTYSLIFIGGAIALLVFTAIQQYCFRYMSEKLASRLREMHFRALCRQSIGFFDEAKNATGALTADLATATNDVSTLFGESQGRALQGVFTCVLALIVSFILGSWALSIMMLVIFPLLIIGNYIRTKQIGGATTSQEFAESGAYATQALCNIKTVVSLSLEKTVSREFLTRLEAPNASFQKQTIINGLAIGFSSFITFAAYALVFWVGGQLVKRDELKFSRLLRTLMCMMMSAQSIGPAMSYFSEMDGAKLAAAKVFALVDRQVPIDATDTKGKKLQNIKGALQFDQVVFSYPTRPDRIILANYNLRIAAGDTVAFCGPSGGGKSTIIALLERFYDPLAGTILLDNHNLQSLNIAWLRSQIGLVGQEPTLFHGTVAENLAYGLENMPELSEIVQAAKTANAHEFIMAFSDGYKTQVGTRGGQLSGGQKQRIAIARAILKDPKLLLLDEATSALDSESEKIVQMALDKVVAMKRRTTIVIAHRLSTIRSADKICVVSEGSIAEQGTHSQLLKKNGMYARLLQSIGVEG